MKLRIACCLLVGAFLLCIGLTSESNSQQAPTGALPHPTTVSSQNGLDRLSAPFQFILSPQGRKLLRMGTHPLSKALLKWMGEDTTGVPDFVRKPRKKQTLAAGDPSFATGCLSTTGNVFNLEPTGGDPLTGLAFPLPQNEESVDFLPNALGSTSTGPDIVVEGANDFRGFFGGLGSSLSGYYVHRVSTVSDCTASFEGGMPAVSAGGEDLFGFGDPVVAADPVRNQVFYASLGLGPARSDVNLYSTTAANLMSTTACPSGTHDSFDAAGCWPNSIGIDPQALCSSCPLIDKPHMRVDEAATGVHTGAGDVYVAYTYFDTNFSSFENPSHIRLVACKNDLSACSTPETISAAAFTFGDFRTQFPHISVRPDGSLSITYIDLTQAASGNFGFSIKYVSCTANGAPTAPTCSGGSPGLPGAPQLVLTDANALPFFNSTLSGEGFRVATYPKNDYQVESNAQIWEYIVWDRCRVPLLLTDKCPDSNVMAVAANTGISGAPLTAPTWSHAFAVDTTLSKHQFQPWIRTDASRNIINIMYYSNSLDSFNHRPNVLLRQIFPCAGTAPCAVGAAFTVTSTMDEPQGDNIFFDFGPGFGDYHALAARGTGTGASRAYVGFTGNNRLGLTDGLISMADEDNYITSISY